VSSASPTRGWLPETPLDAAVLHLRTQAFEIAHRDPPLAGDALYLNDHGVPHIEAVLRFAGQLTTKAFIQSITEVEMATLYAAALTHDLGLYRYPEGLSAVEVRERHAALSGEWVRSQIGGVVGEDFARVLSTVVAAHARSFPIASVPLYDRIPESAQLLRPRLLVAMLRIADGLHMGRGRTPIAIYRHYEGRLPERSAPFWSAHQLVNDCELDLEKREVVLHLAHEIDPADAHLRMLYTSLQSEFDAIPGDLWDVCNCVRLHVVFAHRGARLAPGRIYAESLQDALRD
jgi:hypothetical protein